MIVYFADRQLNILGQASTELPNGLVITEDLKTEDIESGVAVFECAIPFDDSSRALVESCTKPGNYILRSYDGANEFYTIAEREIDTKRQEVSIYAEDAGLDLLNEIVEAYEADAAYPISHYVEMFAYDSGFEIGINEASDLTRKLSWDGEATAAERIASVATQFDGCEISFSFAIKGLEITNKYINIYRERGKDIGANLRLNEDIDKIVTKESIINLATALKCTGGTPEDENTEDDIEPVPITLEGYAYDDGDFYIDGVYLKSRKALEKWSRYSWTKEPNQTEEGGHITRPFSYDTLSQQTLLAHALTELKKACQMEVNYEIDINKLPENIKIGDRINIIDDAGELYVSARVLKFEESVADQTQKATLGEFLIKTSGISAKVEQLAERFASTSASAARALKLAKDAATAANSAKAEVDEAVKSVEEAQKAVEEVADVVEEAKQSAASAQQAAAAAESIVDSVEERVGSMETTVANAQTAANNAHAAAETAQDKADEAAKAAAAAQNDANIAKADSETAVSTASSASTNASSAKNIAENAKGQAESAYDTAIAAKADSDQAKKDVAALADSLETVSNTMEADYTRKTDLTETTAQLQTQISQNAAKIQLHAESIVTIDETTNNAYELAQSAQGLANAAQAQADQATADALAAQNAADNATAAANAAQSEADKANAAAATAKSAVDKAEADLAAAQADLATITSRVGVTEEEIATAQQAVQTAQAAADKAKQDAATADKKAADAQAAADTAAGKADTAKQAADDAADLANTAQQVANEAKGKAEAAQQAAFNAGTAAANAQTTANQAVADAAAAQSAAAKADADAKQAVADAEAADKAAAQAASDLVAAKKRLAEVQADANSTQSQITAAQAAVNTAQAAVDAALVSASEAAAYAAQAAIDAENAREAAAKADAEAKTAQAAAKEAKDKADEAFDAAGSLANRVTQCESDILTAADNITLYSKKTEVAEQLNGYYTKTQTDAKIKVEADKIATQATQISGLTTKTSTLEQRADGFDVSIADSAKTATSFLTYDATNGLQVGNKQSGSWSGYRAQIKNDAYNILNASGAQLASFGANTVDIGKNSQDTQIRFCNGKAVIHYDSSNNYTQLDADRIQLYGGQIATVSSRHKEGAGESYQNSAVIHAISQNGDPHIQIAASRYMSDADGISVGDIAESDIFVNYDGIVAESGESIRLIAPTVTVEGDAGITGHYYDNEGQPIRNGLSAYASSGINPNTTLEHLVLTNVNTPVSGTYFYITTFFYGTKSTSANRAQIAVPYNSLGAIYFRYCYSGSWSAWRKPFYSGDDAEFSKIELIRGTPYIDFRHGSSNADYTQRIITSDGGLLIYGTTNTYVAIMSDRLRSNGNDVHYLGDASNKWKAVYAVSGSIQTSDRTQKKNIESIDDRYVALFDKLQPVTFEFNDVESDRVHIGFISQDVKEAMDEVGLTDLDFAGYCRDIKTETVEVADPETGETSQVEREVLDENGDPAYLYSLRYSEFIALNSKMIQMNRQKIAEQEKEIQTLRDELSALKETVALLVGRDKEA